MSKFKVGDAVITKSGERGIITMITDNCHYPYHVSGMVGTFSEGYLELVSRDNCSFNLGACTQSAESSYLVASDDTINILNNSFEPSPFHFHYEAPKTKNIMQNIIEFAKNMTLSADEKLLRKYNLHNDKGEDTDDARKLIMDNFYATPENQAYLLSIATAKDAEDAKK
jgi:hypothetical protein